MTDPRNPSDIRFRIVDGQLIPTDDAERLETLSALTRRGAQFPRGTESYIAVLEALPLYLRVRLPDTGEVIECTGEGEPILWLFWAMRDDVLVLVAAEPPDANRWVAVNDDEEWHQLPNHGLTLRRYSS